MLPIWQKNSNAVLYGPLKYQGIGVKNLYFLQGIIHIIVFLNKYACNSSIGKLLRSNAGLFRVEMGIPFPLTSTTYYEKTYASYMPSGRYKNFWRFMSNPLFKLEITEDYDDLLVLSGKDEYLLQAFFAGGFRNTELKALNFVRKLIQASKRFQSCTSHDYFPCIFSCSSIESAQS